MFNDLNLNLAQSIAAELDHAAQTFDASGKYSTYLLDLLGDATFKYSVAEGIGVTSFNATTTKYLASNRSILLEIHISARPSDTDLNVTVKREDCTILFDNYASISPEAEDLLYTYAEARLGIIVGNDACAYDRGLEDHIC